MTSFVAKAQAAHMARRSVGRLREAVRAGTFTPMAAVDPQTGEVIDPEARALFASLPAITPATAPDELVAHGLLNRVPHGLNDILDRPRYRVDRELFVRTTVVHEAHNPRRPVGAYHPEGQVRFTHRARLKKRRGEDFLVELEGAPRLLRFAKTDIFAWNEPCGVPPSGGTISGVQVDYNDPRFKAHICAGYMQVHEEIEALSFIASDEDILEQQTAIIHRLASMVNMQYSGRGEGFAGSKAGSLINGGLGVCFVQRAVAGAFLQAFARVLNFEVQMAVGRTLRLGVPHGFVVLTLFPSMSRFVCDPAWSEPLTDLRVAFFGPSWGHDRQLEGFEGEQNIVVRAADINVPEASA